MTKELSLNKIEYKSPLTKFEIMSMFFGFRAIKLEPTGGNTRKERKQLRALKKSGAIVSHDAVLMKQVLRILQKQPRNNEELKTLANILS